MAADAPHRCRCATPLCVQVACGGGNALVVCEHDVRRFDPDSKEAADAAMAAFGGMMDTKPPKQLRIQVGCGRVEVLGAQHA